MIIGDTVSHGYFRQPELTKKAFLICEKEGVLYGGYRTGDAGYLKDGYLYYCGRQDLQVKLHGYRIEIEDIENNLLRLQGISRAVVVPNMKEGKVRSLTAFISGEGREDNNLEASRRIKERLKLLIPDYMIPKKIVFLDNMPVTRNGKVDRSYLKGLKI